MFSKQILFFAIIINVANKTSKKTDFVVANIGRDHLLVFSL